MTDKLPKIFIAIASYRDPECQYTVCDAFSKAAHPERIFIGVCSQYDPQQDQDCFLVPAPYPDQVRELRVLAHDSQGACWARAQALSLMQDEDYVLLIDAHMRFAPGWDSTLIDTLSRCPTSQAVLSGSTPHYYPPNQLQTNDIYVLCIYVQSFDRVHPLHLNGYYRPRSEIQPMAPLLSAFVIFNFIFAPAKMFRDIPIDPHIYFRGIESTYSLRLWTHGYDIYQPDSIVLYHYWERVARSGSSGKDEYKTIKGNARAELSQQRVQHILGLQLATDSKALIDIEKYGIGNVRSVRDFWRFAGIDPMNGTLEEKARKGLWTSYKA